MVKWHWVVKSRVVAGGMGAGWGWVFLDFLGWRRGSGVIGDRLGRVLLGGS